jgi:ribosomal protein S18 acetylase RimI-like enzyme
VSDLLVRPLAAGEAGQALDVHLSARWAAAAQGTMPPSVHPRSDYPRWFAAEVMGHREIWVAERPGGPAGELVGLLVLDAAFLDQLYVRPGAQRQGIGTALLDLAKALRPAGFDLWVFEVNRPAIAFYERSGLVLVEQTSGAGNDERAPDRRYRWPARNGPARTSSVGTGGETGLA